MNKKSMIKIGVVSLLIFFVVILFLMFVLPRFSSAIIDKNVYVLGEKVRIDLEGSNYAIKIITPSTSYIKKGSNGVLLFKPEEIGKYKIILEKEGKTESYEFEVVGEGEEKESSLNGSIMFKENITEPNVSLEINNISKKLIQKKAEIVSEQQLSREKKQVRVRALRNISEVAIASASVDEITRDKRNIKVYWKEQNKDVEFEAKDEDNDGLIDKVEWVVEADGEQTFEIIIIIKAEHLDAERNSIEDIYSAVSEKDNIWKTIPDGHYVRATFEENLTSENDITIYARGNGRVEVYEKDGLEKIAEFQNIGEENWHKVFLTELQGQQDTFDLKVLGDVEFDYIVDPTPVTIDDDIEDATYAYGSGASVVFINSTKGFVFYIDNSGTGQPVYRVTNNSGQTWGVPVVLSAQTDVFTISVWYDRWTPGNTTGTDIHIAFAETGTDSYWYERLNTVTESQLGEVDISGSIGRVRADDQAPSIVKSTANYLFISGGGDQPAGDGPNIWKSTNYGSSWTETNPGFAEDDDDDEVLLMPVSGGDIMAIYIDSNETDFLSRVYNEASDSWDASDTIIDDNDFRAGAGKFTNSWSGTLNKNTNDLFLIGNSRPDNAAADIRLYKYNSTTWINFSYMYTNIGTTAGDVALSIDENNGDIYAIFIEGGDAEDNTSMIKYRVSSDNMTTWSEKYTTSSDDGDFVHLGPSLFFTDILYTTYFDEDLNDLLGTRVFNLSETPESNNTTSGQIFSNYSVTSIGLAPFGYDKFILGWCDDSFDKIKVAVYNTSGAGITNVADQTAGSCIQNSVGHSVSVSALNSTEFVIGWYDNPSSDISFMIFNSILNNLTAEIDVDTDVGYSGAVSVSALDSTSFVIGWFDDDESIIEARTYLINGTPISSLIIADSDSGGTASSVEVSALNSTAFVIAWWDDNGNDITFRTYDISGNQITSGDVDADTNAATSRSVSVSALNSTAFVIGWYDQNLSASSFMIYTAQGENLTGTINNDNDVGTAMSTSVAAISNDDFVIAWYDASTDTGIFTEAYMVNGTNISGEVTVQSASQKYMDVASEETATGIQLCENAYIIAVSNTSSSSFWKLYYPNGSAWNGICPTNVPAFSNINVSQVINPPSTVNATFAWLTNLEANSSISYGKTTALGNSTGDNIPVINHSIIVSRLDLSTLYYYNLTSCIDGRCNTTGTFNFTTLGGDTLAPAITIVFPLNQIYNTSAINFNVSLSEEGSWCGFSLDGRANVTMTQFNSTYFYYPRTYLREGSHNIIFSCSDNFNNFNSSSINFSVSFNVPRLARRNSTTIDSGANNVTVYLNVTDASKAFLVFSSRTADSDPSDIQITGELLSDRIIFRRYGTGTTSYIEWEVIENPDLYVQRGEILYNSTETNKMIFLEENFNISSSFLIITNRLNITSGANSYMGFWGGGIINSATLNFTRGPSGAEGNLSWQAVEWTNSNVKNGTSVMSSTSSIITSFLPSVNLSRSFLIFSRSIHGGASADDMSDTMVAGHFFNESSVRFFRRGADGTANVNWFVVENSEFYVQRNFAFFLGLTPFNSTINPINLSLSFALTSWDAQGTGNTQSRAEQTHKLVNETILQFQKADTNNNQNNSWFVISFGNVYVLQLIEDYTPLNGTYHSTTTLDFNVSLTREGSWCGFSLDGVANVTMTKFNNTYFNYIKTGLLEGNHNLTFSCNDTSGVFDSSDLIFFTVDISKPNIVLLNPPDNTLNTTTNTIRLYYNVTDSSPISNCSLILNGSRVTTDYTITKSISQYFDAYLSNGNYTWSVNCTDSTNNENNSETRRINTSVSVLNDWQERWWEISSEDFNLQTAEIDLSNNYDATENKNNVDVAAYSLYTIADAKSPYFGNKGVLIPASTSLTFNAYANVSVANYIYITWEVYITNYSGNTLICRSGDNSTGGTRMSSTSVSTWTGSCSSPASSLYLKDSDRISLIINLWNNYSSSINVNHFWDNGRLSFVEFSDFTVLGELKTELSELTSDQSIALGQNLNVSCNVNCSVGSCLNTQVYLRYNTSSQNWQDVGSSGSIILETGETNPHSLGTVTSPNVATNFTIKGNTISSLNNLRCIGVSDYSSYNGTKTIVVNVTSGNNPPGVNLTSPPSGNWFNYSNLILYYNISDPDNNIVNCSLYTNNIFNKTNSSSIVNNAENNFTFSSSDDTYNWTVLCFDITNLNGTDSARIFYIDTTKPLINLIAPGKNQSFSNQNVLFNFTTTDALSPNMTCNLTIDSTIRESNINLTNGSYYNKTFSMDVGTHWWNVTCWDIALNTNISETWNFSVTNTPPIVNLTSPASGVWFNTSSVTLFYNVTDNNYPANCSLYINNLFNQTNSSSIVNNAENNFTFSSSDDTYNWTVLCFDVEGLNGTATERNFTIDTTKPSIVLNAPGNNNVSLSSSVAFNFTATDNLDNSLICNLTINSIVVNSSFAAQNGSLTNLLVTGLIDGDKYWNVTCWDEVNNTNTSATWRVNVTEAPRITLNTQNSSWFNGSVILNYTPTDNTNFSRCDLYLNSVFNQTNQSAVRNGQINNFTLAPSDGVYTWSVNCTDVVGITNVSETRIFYKDGTKPSINLSYPQDGEQVYTSPIQFNFTTYDNLGTNLTCNLTVDSNNSLYDFNTTNGSITTRYLTIEPGLHFWNVTCWDDALNFNTSATWNFTNYASPLVTLDSPEEGYWSNESNNTLSYSVYDADENIANCSLYINSIFNKTNSSEIINDDINSFEFNATDGIYNWSVDCWDTSWLNGSDGPRVLYIDTRFPQISLTTPYQAQILSSNNITFNFTTTDNLDSNLSCDLYVNDFEEFSNINAQNGSAVVKYLVRGDGNYSWYVACMDNATNTNTSIEINFTIEAPPNVTLNYPLDGNRTTSQSITFIYTPYDPISISNCSLYIDDTFNDTDTTISNNQQNNFPVSGIPEGNHNWTVECFDSDNNGFKPSVRMFIIDKSPPSVFLMLPENDSGIDYNQNSISFKWNASDVLDSALKCNLTIDGIVPPGKSNMDVTSGVPRTEDVSVLTLGEHLWNVTCWDQVYNKNTSATWQFNYTYPDFYVNITSIIFNKTEPEENENVLINATIYNLGGANVSGVIVSFFKGDPDSGGTQINGNKTISIGKYNQTTTNITWSASLGTNEIFVIVDPPLATNGSFDEWNESNNKASKNITIGTWQFFYGNVTEESEYRLADNSSKSVIKWKTDNFQNGSIFVADYESVIFWSDLEAIGKNISRGNTTNDFTDMDILLGTANFNDSVYNVYTNDGQVKNTTTIIAFNKLIEEMPVANSINNSNFVTGILWDAGDNSGDAEYSQDDEEDLVFLAIINKNKQGAYGIYDYELRVPAKLREYKGASSEVVFYAEIF